MGQKSILCTKEEILVVFLAFEWYLRFSQQAGSVKRALVLVVTPCILIEIYHSFFSYHQVRFDFMFQLNVLFLYYIYHIHLHVSSNFMLIIRRIHCIHTASGSLYVILLRWPLSARAVRRLTACALIGHLRRGDIQRTRCCMYTMNPPNDEHNVARNM